MGEGISGVRKNETKSKPEAQVAERNQATEGTDIPEAPLFGQTPTPHEQASTISLKVFDHTLISFQTLYNTSLYLVTRSGASKISPSEPANFDTSHLNP